MQDTPRGLRLHIGIFGRRNVGKSSLLNALTHQQISIVSDVAGTTTDPVEKAMELQPIGPVLFVDTAGIDEDSDLGMLRIAKTQKIIERVDIAILVTDEWRHYENDLLAVFREKAIPCIVVANKSDLRADDNLEQMAESAGARRIATVSAQTGDGIAMLRRELIEAAPEDFFSPPAIVGDLVPPGELVMLVVPIDKEAPKGRLILPQVQTIRDILDNDAYAMIVKERELAVALSRLNRPPALVVTDSQEFLKVTADVPPGIPVTSFSILFSRFKGDLAESVRGAMAIDALKPGDRVLIAEGCTHHPVGEDIGRVKIPRWLEQYIGGGLEFDVYSGQDFPRDIGGYNLIVHCGACVLNRRAMIARIDMARSAGVPITNYGLAIAWSLGIFKRALEPFPHAYEQYIRAKNAKNL